MKPLILLDKDGTCFYEGKMRPYVKEFILGLIHKFDFGFYTFDDVWGTKKAIYCMIEDWGMSKELCFDIYRKSLYFERHKHTGSKKDLMKAAKLLWIEIDEIFCLYDDSPDISTWEYQDKLKFVPAWYGDVEDTFFQKELEKLLKIA